MELTPFEIKDLAKGHIQEAPENKPAQRARQIGERFKTVPRFSPPFFSFQESGDFLIATLTDVQQGVGQYQSRVYTFRIDGEKPTFVRVWGKEDLDAKIQPGQVELGQLLDIELTGTLIQPNGNEGKQFAVSVFQDPKKG